MATSFEYRYGPRILIELPLDADTDDITPGMAITTTGATEGYFQNVDGNGDNVYGIAVNKVSSPSADGGANVLVDVSQTSVYEVPPDTGTAAVTINQNTCDVGADGKSVKIDGSSTDDIVILYVDTNTNTCFVRLNSVYAGVA
tara:strand:+ start:184 stop:612 length:429 start_codon:yes stop_codon:yes gene_type:complete